MVSLASLQSQFATNTLTDTEYQIQRNLDLYDSPDLTSLATQAWGGRHLKFEVTGFPTQNQLQALSVCLCEDGYPGWISAQVLDGIHPAAIPYSPPVLTSAEIQQRLATAIAFATAAMAQPNVYLWGGTVGPNYDCSGLVQRAFAAQGVWLPRDAYQQEAFTKPIANPGKTPADLIPALQPGDLIFFGPPEKATHVALYVGDGNYIHSSGQDQGRNGIAMDRLSDQGDPISCSYYEQVRGAGRVVRSYQPIHGQARSAPVDDQK